MYGTLPLGAAVKGLTLLVAAAVHCNQYRRHVMYGILLLGAAVKGLILLVAAEATVISVGGM